MAVDMAPEQTSAGEYVKLFKHRSVVVVVIKWLVLFGP